MSSYLVQFDFTNTGIFQLMVSFLNWNDVEINRWET